MTHKELESLLLHVSRGRYTPPNKTFALKVIMGMMASVDNVTTAAMKALQVKHISPSISGKYERTIN